ncbi:hypothetical protein [Butyrivibrio sp. MB2005]|uniref:hypothetical protein n=1 Tax=Butyrivibrio sp. MB2005 TaxID=1280678 RepID=UPI000407CB46|nr:hypothetical protein [Butyrivibrio sp. MB2005]
MREYVEELIRNYPSLIEKRAYLRKQIDSYKPIPEEDIIISMCYCHPEGDQVQSSGTSDKTAKTAMIFRQKTNRMNEQALAGWTKDYVTVDEEISFLEECIAKLPFELAPFMQAMVMEGLSWDDIESAYGMSRKLISKYRSQALDELSRIYQARESQVAMEMLS